ncbi:uncharacterized protein LOC121185470 [Toxotes jaculatrix]|uniref:uncharacterized protein LOC121185470 n=1 Tax=Toxotes jaculatrix TaxID=941984 RepID=UPI001B3B12A4|nr:uncharacterized protein LOC121185470 [Toxotes jaculatrix]
MASTPSASALSAVLRCRGNLWTRNPQTKRPPSSAYSLGLAGGALRDSPAERNRANQASVWEAFLRGERVVVGGRLTVEYKLCHVDGKILRKKDFREINNLYCSKLSYSSEDAHSAAPGVQNALVRQQTHKLTSDLPGIDKCSTTIQMNKYAARVCKMVSLKEVTEFPAGVLKVSITAPCFKENAGQSPSFVFTGWSALKSTCLSLTSLVSEFMFLRLAVLWRSSSSLACGDAPQHLLCQQHEKIIEVDALQADRQIHSPTALTSSKDNSGCEQKLTEDRPD